MTNFSTRKYVPNDYNFCESLVLEMKDTIMKHRKCTLENIKSGFYKNIQKEITHIIISNTKSIGFFQTQQRDNCDYINELHISSIYRNKGIGYHVLEIIEKQARSRGVNSIQLEVFLDNPAKKLYERYGFVKTQDTNAHSIYMKKNI